MKEEEFKVGDLVSFIHNGQKMNGTIEYILEDDEYVDGTYVVKPHPRYKVDQFILSKDDIKKLLEKKK